MAGEGGNGGGPLHLWPSPVITLHVVSYSPALQIL